MYEIGEYVVCGNNGICQVEAVTTLNLEGVDKSRKYYLMKPVFSNGSTVYKPTDLDDGSIRPALNRKGSSNSRTSGKWPSGNKYQ